MVAIGVVYERYREKGVELHQYNIRTGTVYDCDLDGDVVDSTIPDLTVEQNIILHGGCIVSSDQRDSGTYDWDWNEEFKRDVETMWRISCRNPGLWNSQLSMLDEMEQRFAAHSADGLHFNVDIPTAEAFFKKRHLNMNLRGIFYQLEKAGLISQLENEGECVRSSPPVRSKQQLG